MQDIDDSELIFLQEAKFVAETELVKSLGRGNCLMGYLKTATR
jgi:hypothetical protein